MSALNKLLAVILAVTPMVYYNGFFQSYCLAKAYFFRILISVLAIPLILTTDIRSKKPWLLAVIGWLLIGCFAGADPTLSWFGQHTVGIGINTMLLLLLVMYFIMNRFTRKDIVFMERCFVVTGLCFAAFQIWRYSETGLFHINGLGSHQNMTGNVFALLIPIALKAHPLLAIPLIAGLLISACRGAMVATFLVLFFWFVRSKTYRWIFIGTVVLTIFLGRMLPESTGVNWKNRVAEIFHYENTTRGYMFASTLPLLKNPLGVSLGNFRMAVAPIKSQAFENRDPKSVWDNPHNIYLNTFTVFGWAIGIIWLFVLWYSLRSSERYIRYATFAYMVSGISSFDTMDTLPILSFILAVGLMTPTTSLKEWL